MKERATMRCKREATTRRGEQQGEKESNNAKRRAEHEESRAKHEEKEKGESGAQAKLEPHLKLDLELFFSLGLMVVPTIMFSLVMAYIGTTTLFFIIIAYTNTHNFVLSPLTTYTLNLNPSHIHIWAWI
jgi:hypothetical protein